MSKVWLVLLLALGCSDKDTGGGTDDSGPADDTGETGETGDSGGTDCPDGPGVIDGVLLGSDGVPLGSGRVRLYDSTGSEELVYDNVDTEGSFHLVYSQGEYVIRGEYSTCVGEDIPVTICGDQTKIETITLSCAP